MVELQSEDEKKAEVVTKADNSKEQTTNKQRDSSLVVSDLYSETKGSRLEFGCWLCVEVGSMQ